MRLGETAVKKLLRQRIRSLMRETPGDAQYVELMGSMEPINHRSIKLMRRHTLEVDVPIHVKAYNAPDDDELNGNGTHMLVIDIEDPDIEWSPSDASVGVNAGFEAGNDSNWHVIGIDGYALEDSDGERIKAWLRSRPDVMGFVDQEIARYIEDEASSQDPPERGGRRY